MQRSTTGLLEFIYLLSCTLSSDDLEIFKEPVSTRRQYGLVSIIFFFQAEDGIRDYKVTGVQTCALPISDVVARAFADHAGKALGQPFVVDNKPGANTIVAAQAVAGAPADGYTLLFGATNHSMIPALYQGRVKFDVVRSFRPLCTVASSPTVLVVGPGMPARSLQEYMDQARSRPGSVTAGTAGMGSSGHFATEMFARAKGLKLNHVPYKGAAPVVTDLMGGQLDDRKSTRLNSSHLVISYAVFCLQKKNNHDV